MRNEAGFLFTATFLAFICVFLLLGCGGDSSDTSEYRISGTISAADGSMVDSDINDPEAPYQSNDSFARAQSIGIPISLGGYVNQPWSGTVGRSYFDGDVNDVFEVDLLAGQAVTLVTGDNYSPNDLDLHIYNQRGVLVGSSIRETGVEQLTVSADGTYHVRVEAYSGASNYSLVINYTSLAQQAALSTAGDFVEGDVIVKLKNPSADVASLAQSVALQPATKGADERPMLWRFPEEADAGAAALRSLGVGFGAADMGIVPKALERKLQTLYRIKALTKRADVAYAEPNYRVRAMAEPNDQYYSRQWHYPLIKVDSAWDLAVGTTEAVVAVIDTGILPGHPDLINRQVATGYDFISDRALAGDGNGLDTDPTDVHDGSAFYAFHGSHVAGTIAAETDNDIGIAGVAGSWPVKVMPLRVLGPSGTGSMYDIAQAVYYAAGLVNDSGVTLVGGDVASVINLSLGGPDPSLTLDSAIADARAAGVIVVAAAGNAASHFPSYPAASAGVVSVSSVGADKRLAPYSNFGSTIDVAAPGGDSGADYNVDGFSDGVLSTNGEVNNSGLVDHQYSYLQGTSMAAPHVAGVAALMKTVYPAMTPDLFDAWLAAGELTEDIGDVGDDSYFGHGLIDAHKSVLKAHNTVSGGLAALLYINPSAISFGYITESVSIDVSNLGAGSLTVDTPVDDADWLTVTAQSVDGDGLGRYEVAVNRNALVADGNYSATITFSSSAGDAVIPVTVQKITRTFSADNGLIYILVIPTGSGDGGGSASSSVLEGDYSYQVSGVQAGEYTIVAGSDADNDGFICDSGESCGGYPLLGRMEAIRVGSNVVDMDFGVSYTRGLDGAQYSRIEGNPAVIGNEIKR